MNGKGREMRVSVDMPGMEKGGKTARSSRNKN